MDKYIGIDVHSASCTIAVVDAYGKRVGLHVVATNGQEIVECLAAFPGQKVLLVRDAKWLAIRGAGTARCRSGGGGCCSPYGPRPGRDTAPAFNTSARHG